METQIATTNGTAPTHLSQGIPSRKLVNFNTPRGSLVTRDLESVRDELRRRRELQAPIDHSRTGAQTHVRFGDGKTRASIAFFTPSGLGEPMALTHHALRAFGREVLPGRGLDFLLDEIALGEHGRKLADMNFAAFSRTKTDPRMFRTIMMRDPATGAVRRTLRSIHSTDYAAYDNLEFVEDLLSGGYDRHPLVSMIETDQSIRFRFLLEEPDLDGGTYGVGHKFIPGGKPVPMVECWNSEVGARAVTVKPGMFRLICTNGAGSWEESSTFRWIHRGNRERIQVGVKDALTEIRTTAAGVVSAYGQAMEIAIDDVYAWFERAARGEDLTKADIAAVEEALHDPTTTPGGLLTSVVDAVTLAAQSAIDEFEQERLEEVGSRILRRGLAEAATHGKKLR